MPRPLTTRRIVVGNSLILIAAEAATRAISFLSIAYLSRTLSPDGLGAVEFGFAVFGLVQLIGMGGIDALLTPEAARHPEQIPRLAGRSLVLAACQLAATVVVLLAAGAVLHVSPALRTSALLFAGAAMMAPIGLRFVFVAREHAGVIGLVGMVGQVAFLGLCLAGVQSPDHVARVGMFWIAAVALRIGIALAAFARSYGAIVIATDHFGAWLRRSVALGLGTLSAGLMTSADVVVLGLVSTPEEVARYGLAAKLPIFLGSLIGLTAMALFPTLVRAVSGKEDARVARIGGDVIALGLGLAVPGAVALGLAAEPVMTLLFTDRFRAAAPVLALLAWRFPLTATGSVLQNVLWAQSPEREARVAITVFLATLALLPLGAAHGGAVGVAWCMLLGNVLAIVLFARATGVRGVLGMPTLMRVALGGGVTAVLMHLASPVDGLAAVETMLGAWAVGGGLAAFPVLLRVVRR